jgi:hypothetical protein
MRHLGPRVRRDSSDWSVLHFGYSLDGAGVELSEVEGLEVEVMVC